MSGRVTLEVVAGPLQGRSFPYEDHDMFIFGRARTCNARLPEDGFVSRHHFVLEVNPPNATIRDLGSSNGTHVNGVKYGGRERDEEPAAVMNRSYPEVDLRDGDEIVVGKTQIRVKIDQFFHCGECGVKIAAADRAQVEWMTGHFLCAGCREHLHHPPRPGTAIEVLCERCGKEVSEEVSGQPVGPYVCHTCRSHAPSDAGGLRKLLQGAIKEAAQRGPPVIPGYTIGDILGRGGMGAVYRATRTCDNQQVAVKVMLANAGADKYRSLLFLREINVLRRLQHGHVVELFDHRSVGNEYYFVMELCNAGSLDQVVRSQGGTLSESAAIPLMLQCLDALDHAHRQSFVHRDLKPPNILLDGKPGAWVAKVSDFGLAKCFATAGLSGMTVTGNRAGTYDFMPREQLTEFKYTRPISDLWSLAATFYWVLSGYAPLDFPNDRDKIGVILNDSPVPIRERQPGISAPLAEVFDRSLTIDPTRRYQTAAEFKDAIQKAHVQSR